MKALILVVGFIFTLTGQTTYACSCGRLPGPTVFDDPTFKPDLEEVKRWRVGQVDYPLFIGKVVKIKKIKLKQSNEVIRLKKVTVRVERYWLGVKTPEMVIYTAISEGECGVPYIKGRDYIFWPFRNPNNGLLETDVCSYTKITKKRTDDFDRVFGEAGRFL